MPENCWLQPEGIYERTWCINILKQQHLFCHPTHDLILVNNLYKRNYYHCSKSAPTLGVILFLFVQLWIIYEISRKTKWLKFTCASTWCLSFCTCNILLSKNLLIESEVSNLIEVKKQCWHKSKHNQPSIIFLLPKTLLFDFLKLSRQHTY